MLRDAGTGRVSWGVPSLDSSLARRAVLAMPQSLIPGFTSYNASRCGTLSTVAPESKRGGPLLSIVIPAYNEEKRLPRYLLEGGSIRRVDPGRSRVLIVDDGSYDGTSAYVQAAWANHPCLRIVTLDKNQGKGAAVRRGVFDFARRVRALRRRRWRDADRRGACAPRSRRGRRRGRDRLARRGWQHRELLTPAPPARGYVLPSHQPTHSPRRRRYAVRVQAVPARGRPAYLREGASAALHSTSRSSSSPRSSASRSPRCPSSGRRFQAQRCDRFGTRSRWPPPSCAFAGAALRLPKVSVEA